jgi:hypothetical protein
MLQFYANDAKAALTRKGELGMGSEREKRQMVRRALAAADREQKE